jgi:hypothetical protein
VKDLAKLDLDPNTVYNVSLSISQGAKKFDNLRFFQTKTPKLFNIIPGQYSTFSRLTTALKPITPVFGGGTLNPAVLQTIQITNLTWSSSLKQERSEGENTYNVNKSTITFTITLAKEPPTFVFKIDGFDSRFACLNGRSDWEKVNATTYKVTTSLLEYDPAVNAYGRYINKDTSTGITKFKTYQAASLIYLRNKPTNIEIGSSTVSASVRSGTRYINPFAPDTTVTYVQNTSREYYVIVSPPVGTAFAKDTPITFRQYKWDWGIDWSGTRTASGSIDPSAKLQYYSSPSFNPITRKYSFASDSTVSSEVLNANVLDSLIWENEVRDFIYFFISDTASLPNSKWYYFDNGSDNGGIVSAKYTSTFDNVNQVDVKTLSRISGSDELIFTSGTGKDRVLSLPPPAPIYVISTSSYPSYPGAALRAKATFYTLSKTNRTDDATVPDISYPVSIAFAIARYVKLPNGDWSREWLGAGSDKTIKNVLSLEEQLS